MGPRETTNIFEALTTNGITVLLPFCWTGRSDDEDGVQLGVINGDSGTDGNHRRCDTGR